jgi:hypothetical protein
MRSRALRFAHFEWLWTRPLILGTIPRQEMGFDRTVVVHKKATYSRSMKSRISSHPPIHSTTFYIHPPTLEPPSRQQHEVPLTQEIFV